jgi:hypothetical protein
VTELDASVGGEHGREFAATPLRVDRAMLKRVLLDQTIEMFFWVCPTFYT